MFKLYLNLISITDVIMICFLMLLTSKRDKINKMHLSVKWIYEFLIGIKGMLCVSSHVKISNLYQYFIFL